MTEKLHLSFAIGDYDHTRDIINGKVPVEGIELIAGNHQIEEIFFRFTFFKEWDVSELSMGKYCSLRSQGDTTFTAIPVFISRQFRHSMIYVREGSDITQPGQLKGKRIGVPEWAQTATIYSRGYLTHTAGVPLDSVQWVQAGVNMAGRVEKVQLKLPPNISIERHTDRTLSDMLLRGEIDAILSARQPDAYGKGAVRLFEDYQPAEEAWYRDTGIYPIMHVAAIRTEVLDRHPWIARNLFQAFEEAKRRSYERLSDIAASGAPVAWLSDIMRRQRALFGDDPFPYGLEKNYKTLDAFLQFGFEQGVCHTRIKPEDLFPKSMQASFKV